MANKVKYKWTVFFLIKAVDITWGDAKKMIFNIKDMRLDKGVSILFCLNAKRKCLAELLPAYSLQEDAGENSETIVFLKIKIGNDEINEKNELELLEEPEGFDITDPLHLELFFKSQVVQQHASMRYLLFTWDHGNAYSIFKDDKKNVLTMSQLAEALKTAFGEKKIDLVIMMNCYMQLFDTCFALADVADYLVAAETLFYDMEPYDYRDIFQALMDDPELEPSSIAEAAVASVENMYAGKSISNTQLGMAVFASALKYYPAIAKCIDRLSEAFITLLKDDLALISNCRKNCGQIPSVAAELVDFKNFSRCVQSKMSPGWQSETFPALDNLLQKAILKTYIHPIYETEFDKARPINPSCFSVSFPANLLHAGAAESFYSKYTCKAAKEATFFARQHRWSDFVAAYLAAISKKKL